MRRNRTIRVLVVEDNASFRHFVRSTLEGQQDLLIIGEVSDGLAAVQKAEEHRPDLILLDIGLPNLNGIEVARRIREFSFKCKVLFVSENRSSDVVKEALRTGSGGYVLKSDAASDLLRAVESVLDGRLFVSSSLAGHTEHTDAYTDNPGGKKVGAQPIQNRQTVHHHEVGFYSDDRRFLEDLTRFVGSALEAGNSAIVAATESHRNRLLPRLEAYGLDIGAAIDRGRYIALDAAEVLSSFMVHGLPDPVRFMKAFGEVILTAAAAASAQKPRVAIFGECVHLLWAQGNPEAAVQMEKLGNQLAGKHQIDILCGYSVGGLHDQMDGHIYERICAQHSAVHLR